MNTFSPSYYVGYEEGYSLGTTEAKKGKEAKIFTKSEDIFDIGMEEGYYDGYNDFKTEEGLKEAGRTDAKRDVEAGRGITIPEDMLGTLYEKSYRISYGIRVKKQSNNSSKKNK